MMWWNKKNVVKTLSIRKSVGGVLYASSTLAIAIVVAFLSLAAIIVIVLTRLTSNTHAISDTGSASLTGVDIIQAGTGQSVTIDGYTMDEAQYGDNSTRRTILNNNVVKYEAHYQVTTTGTVTLTFTMPANNTIDSASVSAAAGCQSGSKLEKADIVNSDGTVTKSYTNNKATCIINATANTNTTWEVSAHPWGGNNETVTPTLTTGSKAETIDSDSITVTVMGRPKYEITIGGDNIAKQDSGYNSTSRFYWVLYVPKTSTGLLGIEPLKNGEFVITIAGVTLPGDWIAKFDDYYLFLSNNSNNQSQSVANTGDVSLARRGSDLVVTVKNAATAVLVYPTIQSGGSKYLNYAYSSGRARIRVPSGALPDTLTSYYSDSVQVDSSTNSRDDYQILAPSPAKWWKLSNRGSTQIRPYPYADTSGSPLPGWNNGYSYDAHWPIVQGDTINSRETIEYAYVVAGNRLNNMRYCYTWDASKIALINRTAELNKQNQKVKYGVVSDINGRSCEDPVNQSSFFDSLEEANRYASSRNLRVNAIYAEANYITIPESASITALAWSSFRAIGSDGFGAVNQYIYGDEWDIATRNISYVLTSGLLTSTIKTEPASLNPGQETHVTITPITYGKESNASIETTIPNSLMLKPNSLTYDGRILVEGIDYTITNTNSDNISTNGTTTVKINLGTIGSDPVYPSNCTDSDIQSNATLADGTQCLPTAIENSPHPAIEYDVRVKSTVSTPSALTISSATNGDGTKYASTSFRTKTTTIDIATPPKTFAYSLTASSKDIYAGEDLTYTYTIANRTSDDISAISLIDILPYNGDKRGGDGTISTTNLASYNVTDLNSAVDMLSSANVSRSTSVKLYYTTASRDVLTANPSSAAISWVELTSNDAPSGTNPLPKEATAIKLSQGQLASGETTTLNLGLANIRAMGGNGATIANDISYLSYTPAGSASSTITTSSSPTVVNYLGSLLSLDLAKDNLSASISPHTVLADSAGLTNTITARTKTESGYQLNVAPITTQTTGEGTVVPTTSLVGQTYHKEIPTLPVSQTVLSKDRASWAIKTDSSGNVPDWTGFNAKTPLSLYASSNSGSDTRAITTIIGVSSGAITTLADTYTGTLSYTLTAEP
ncbi:MAG: hypothetical protein Q4C83_00805 [Candidatus Saccharibacteria bacterium]|nr:hypothetical protein [Candidatus Saccharibacteria bacterium]